MGRGTADKYDVVIVGAGPAGLAAAIKLAEGKAAKILLLDRLDFPRDKTCGSAISPKGIEVLQDLGLLRAVKSVAYPVVGMRLVTGKGYDVTLSSPNDTALICCRWQFDEILLNHAKSLGVTFMPNFNATHLLLRDGRTSGVISNDGIAIHADYTVIANGARSQLCKDPRQRHSIRTIMGLWRGIDFRPNHIEMIFDNALAPLYGWLFPESEDRANIGICYESKQNGRKLFDDFLSRHFRRRLNGAIQLGSWKGHPVETCHAVRHLSAPGHLVVGEAGRLTQPATAEGIYQGMLSGVLAAQAVNDMRSGVVEAQAQASYERACRAAFNASFRGAFVWRGFVRWGGLDLLGSVLDQPAVQRQLARRMAHM